MRPLISRVTPYAGVWIEISHCLQSPQVYLVTPYAGVWIEIIWVTPDAGVWIEINVFATLECMITVTPNAGVWIEIHIYKHEGYEKLSHSQCGGVD